MFPYNELGEFLKKRRAELSTRTVGLPDNGGPRRVAGLRREEVAQHASISTGYYTHLEQGRMQASAPVLDVLARVLRLDDERGFLFQLVGKTTTHTGRRRRQKVQPQLQRVLDGGRAGSNPGHRARRLLFHAFPRGTVGPGDAAAQRMDTGHITGRHPGDLLDHTLGDGGLTPRARVAALHAGVLPGPLSHGLRSGCLGAVLLSALGHGRSSLSQKR